MSIFNLFKRKPSMLDGVQITKPDEAQIAIEELEAKAPNTIKLVGTLGSFGGKVRR